MSNVKNEKKYGGVGGFHGCCRYFVMFSVSLAQLSGRLICILIVSL